MMRFQLIDKANKRIHEGVAPLVASARPEIMTWGHRAFLFERKTGDSGEVAVYRETSVFRIGGFGR